jgi:hypothetical protein
LSNSGVRRRRRIGVSSEVVGDFLLVEFDRLVGLLAFGFLDVRFGLGVDFLPASETDRDSIRNWPEHFGEGSIGLCGLEQYVRDTVERQPTCSFLSALN